MNKWTHDVALHVRSVSKIFQKMFCRLLSIPWQLRLNSVMFSLITYLPLLCLTSLIMKTILYIFRIGPAVLRDCKLSELLPFIHTILSCSERWICYKYSEYAVALRLADMSSQYPASRFPHLKPSQQFGHQKTTQLLGIKMAYVLADTGKSFLLSSLPSSFPSSFSPFLLPSSLPSLLFPFIFSVFLFVSQDWSQ